MELSSYQCDDLADGNGPALGCLLDLFPEHLDWHGGVAAYYGAKFRLATAQRAGDRLLCNATTWPLLADRPLAGTPELINTPDGLHFADGWFRNGPERLFPDTDMRLPGPHNRRNAVAALAIAARFGAGPGAAEKVLGTFQGLPYRLQDEGLFAGIRWVNDSIATAPEAVAAALTALGPAVATLICGGHDRGYDFAPIAVSAVAGGVGTFILLPDTGNAIARLLRAAVPERRILEAPDLAAAVALARLHTPAGRTCLFSPGAPSYNAYGSFTERGRHFRVLLEGLG
jgi:UDP-N-acetylmuramoylalanine--D-glutamate ligase